MLRGKHQERGTERESGTRRKAARETSTTHETNSCNGNKQQAVTATTTYALKIPLAARLVVGCARDFCRQKGGGQADRRTAQQADRLRSSNKNTKQKRKFCAAAASLAHTNTHTCVCKLLSVFFGKKRILCISNALLKLWPKAQESPSPAEQFGLSYLKF